MNPYFSINMQIPPESIDPNVTSDKRRIFVQHEKTLHAIVKSSVINVYGPDSVLINESNYSNSCSQQTIIFDDEPKSSKTPSITLKRVSQTK